jgi:hypothetical protein
MSRLLVVGAFAAGIVALVLSVTSGLRSVPTAAAACASGVPSDEIRYRVVATGLSGLAGCDVRAVIARVSGGGAVWSTPRNGRFETRVPNGLKVRAVVKVLDDGSRRRFTVTTAR